MLKTSGIDNCKDQSQQLEDCNVELPIETTDLFGGLNESGSEV
jgi:hypothetical protein